MTSHRLWLVRTAFILLVLATWLGIAVLLHNLTVDTSPQHRPDRPSHPSCVYRPPGTCPDK